ncbi:MULTISPECIES: VOC family protein [unclassified Sphingomonas]|uniref:VOC family protein n=1 Tax=unclassified Sphingomonas TaxID=196159 RepID=UPI000700B2CE|nr:MULTISPECIES: VOC family protein [unclassified Sphingomonas]KQX19655.1 3-demethylubiquinone-9 3-methyltransferase [Sphingomonas sp. Root1294]KQY65856.1 3-demethylubiquinone-9 3-methyltransferase [Sphingomonas sp. Root50]KRB95437.1 3-demethylubiquinone-9 3-methyltransferase [Sphingomonas sp. Root720]
MSRITPCLWFKDQAEEAARFYCSILPDSRIDAVHRATVDSPGPKIGDVLLVEFTLAGQKFQAINGGMDAQYGLAVSMSFGARDQAELDRVWDGLLEGGAAQQCGWLADRYGLHWQIVPENMGAIMADPAKARAAMTEVFKMVKIDIATIEKAVADA